MRSQSELTPRGVDLKNHYGAPGIGSPYGPQTDPYANIVEKNPESFTPMRFDGKKKIEEATQFRPYPGYENLLNPHQLKSGDMTNIAPSATKIIKPEIAGPKLQVEAEVQYPGVVSVPTFLGMRKQMHPVTVYDKETGEISNDTVIINAPEYKNQNQVMNIKHPFKKYINLKDGKFINTDNDKKLHGISEAKLSNSSSKKEDSSKTSKKEGSDSSSKKEDSSKTSKKEDSSKTSKKEDSSKTSKKEYSSKTSKKEDSDSTSKKEDSIKTSKL
jgi:hypothetical protein